MADSDKRPTESADVNKIVSKLWLLSNRTESIELLIEQLSELWTPEEKGFLLHLPDPALKCNAFFSKIINQNDAAINAKLMTALRNSGNSFVAQEISDSVQDDMEMAIHGTDPLTKISQKLVKIPSNLLDEDGDEVLLSMEDKIPSRQSSSSEGFDAINLEPNQSVEKETKVKTVTYEYSGLIASSAQLKFIFKLPIQKIVDPNELFISESYYPRITNLHLNNFIINQNHLIHALKSCEALQVLDLLNVYFEPQTGKLSNVMVSKVWFPNLRKFTFYSKSIPGTSYSTESYSWDNIVFIESSKGQPANLRTIWQSRIIDISIKTLSMEVEVNHQVETVSFTLFRRQFNGQPMVPEYFLDSFLRNCRRVQFLQINLPEICGKIDFDSLPQELVEMNLTGVVMTGQLQSAKPIRKIFLANCILPSIFLNELSAILPFSTSIQLSNCQQENNSTPINDCFFGPVTFDTMAIKKNFLVFIFSFVAFAASEDTTNPIEDTTAIPWISPWTYECVLNTIDGPACQRVPINGSVETRIPLSSCLLTCGEFGALWPYPNGKTILGKTLTTFSTSGLKSGNLTAPTEELESRLRKSVEIMIENLEKLIPNPNARGPFKNVPLAESNNVLEVNVNIRTNVSKVSFGIDESYILRVNSTKSETGNITVVQVYIEGATFFGARHALETLTQLVSFHEDLALLQVKKQ
ncbi:unnamed protein product [Allacma fusca]|uniref:Beta-hexosaminidase eukaryotic type N-terminal domain-containing protein n=1 Tax=Allacma fusca TaxID=39272 RepID=A0A8J2M9M3_9HEXA|nr:unnamed protein product [Allacma fusca]